MKTIYTPKVRVVTASSGEHTSAKSPACEWLYKKLAKGELKPVEL